MSLHVVVVPGLGAVGYLQRFAAAVRARGARCTVLDLPGLRQRPLVCEPTVQGLGFAAAERVLGLDDEHVVLMGHSTGAQAALHAAAWVEQVRPLAGLVLAGPTVAPTQRSLWQLALRAPRAYRRDSPRELLDIVELARAPAAVVRLVRSGVADRPEATITKVVAPVTVTAGRADALAPRWWRHVLVAQAIRASGRRDIELPGSHNNPFTHPGQLADVAVSAPAAARAR
ncbi:alpha/beta fold hydrolase [Angustibacter sp. Root456]|uniref:alpha/beta fold hydrolase n=1 Tax=Angustibacter sp. Root456 TaxID=1736539 RepID=UPI0006F917C6|nr:alpha/beta fold hydrolase [Angustibacter sp. Root456]KQX66290.1 hypothetical protein ASD06_08040 [Angustibacter sp. Root456]